MIVIGGEALVDFVDERGSVHAVPGGGPFNTAIAFGRLKIPVGFFGALSRDAHGRMLVGQLVDSGVDTSLVRWSDAPTPHAVVHRGLDGKNEYTFHLDGTSLADLSPGDLPTLPRGAWALYVGTLALAVDPPAAAFEALVEREVGRRQIVFDPNVRPTMFGDVATYRRRFERLVQLADLVKLSEDDAAWIYPGLSAERALAQILAFGPRIVAVTKGERGAIAGSGNVVVDVAGVPVAVADTVGAGDSFGAALIAALVNEGAFGPDATQPPDESVLARAVSYAVAGSAITCTRTGAVPPSREEIDLQLRTMHPDDRTEPALG